MIELFLGLLVVVSIAKLAVDLRQSRHLDRLERRLQAVEALAVDAEADADMSKRYRGEEAEAVSRPQLRPQPIPMEWPMEVSSRSVYGSTQSVEYWSTQALCPPPRRARHRQ